MKSFVEEITATPGGEKIRACIQCGICTGSCPGGPDVPTMATTGLAEHVLDPLEADFVQLKDGVTRDEFIGNADWVAHYKMTSFEGKVNIPGCKYDLEIP